MAGIGAYVPGEEATVRDVYWQVDAEELSYVAELEHRSGGGTDEDKTVCDYGSDIGIDPALQPSGRVKFVELNDYEGMWIHCGNELHIDRVISAHDRVVQNRRFQESFERDTEGDAAKEKWLQELATQTRKRVVHGEGCFVPGAVAELESFSPEIIAWLREDEDRLRELDDRAFEQLLIQIIEKTHCRLMPVSKTRRKDGGVDIVVWPQSDMPYVVAVQAKHHTKNQKTGVRDVRDFFGTLQGNLFFSFGFLVTNTRFTADAKEFAARTKSTVRLRDGRDVCRWLGSGFSDVAEWKEIPDKISLAPGVAVNFPRHSKPTDLRKEINGVRSMLDGFFSGLRDSNTTFGR